MQPWVAYAAMSTFILAGGGILLGEHGAKRLGEWVGLAAVAGLFVTAAWVSFGPGPRNCTALLFFVSTSASAWLCRGAFGIGSLLVLLVFFLMVRRLRG